MFKKALSWSGLWILIFMFSTGVYATGENVLVLPQLAIDNQTIFDNLIAKARLTGGGDSDYQVLSVPLNANFQPMAEVPSSTILTNILSQLSSATRSDGLAFQDGDFDLLFGLKDGSYSVVVRSNVDFQLNGVVLPHGAVLTENYQVLPVVRDFDVTILMVTDELLTDLSQDIDSANLPQVGDFIVAQVYSINRGERYRLTSIGLEGSILIWSGQIENREPEELNPVTGSQSENRPPNVPVPTSYTIRLLALISMEERIEAWLNRSILINEDNCFVLHGECYRQGYLGDSYNDNPIQTSYGTILGVVMIVNEYVLMVGYELESGERFTIPFNAGSTDTYPNGLGIVFFDTTTLFSAGSFSGIMPDAEGYDFNQYFNRFSGSPILVGNIVGEINYLPEYAQHVEFVQSQRQHAIEFVDFMVNVTNYGQSPYSNPLWYMNTIPTTTEGLVIITSINFARYV